MKNKIVAFLSLVILPFAFALGQSKFDTLAVRAVHSKGPDSTVAVMENATFRRSVGSKTFQDLGFLGSGWKIDSLGTATLQNLTVRGRMRVYELLINQIRATNGSVFVSSTGKVDYIRDYGDGTYRINTDTATAHGFFKNDIIHAQRFTGTGVYSSYLRVDSVYSTIRFKATRMNDLDGLPSDEPQPGYEYVRIGNTTDTTRQGVIYLTADDTNAPAIVIKDGVNSIAAFSSPTTTRCIIGNLNGLSDPAFPTLGGYGIMTDNGFYKAQLIAAPGSIVKGDYIEANTLSINAIKNSDVNEEWVPWADARIHYDSMQVKIYADSVHYFSNQLRLLTSLTMDLSGIGDLWRTTEARIDMESAGWKSADDTSYTGLQSKIDLKASTQTLNDSLNQHRSRIGTAELNISTEQTARSSGDLSILSQVASSTSALSSRIGDDSLRVNAANTSITQESSDRIAGDATQEGKLRDSVATLKASIALKASTQSVNDSLASHRTRMGNAEISILTEQSTRSSADATLSDRLRDTSAALRSQIILKANSTTVSDNADNARRTADSIKAYADSVRVWGDEEAYKQARTAYRDALAYTDSVRDIDVTRIANAEQTISTEQTNRENGDSDLSAAIETNTSAIAANEDSIAAAKTAITQESVNRTAAVGAINTILNSADSTLVPWMQARVQYDSARITVLTADVGLKADASTVSGLAANIATAQSNLSALNLFVNDTLYHLQSSIKENTDAIHANGDLISAAQTSIEQESENRTSENETLRSEAYARADSIKNYADSLSGGNNNFAMLRAYAAADSARKYADSIKTALENTLRSEIALKARVTYADSIVDEASVTLSTRAEVINGRVDDAFSAIELKADKTTVEGVLEIVNTKTNSDDVTTIIGGTVTASFIGSKNIEVTGDATTISAGSPGVYIGNFDANTTSGDAGGMVILNPNGLYGYMTADGELPTETFHLDQAGGRVGSARFDATRIYIGDGDYNGSSTSFYVDTDGKFSLGDKLTYDGSGNLTISGTFTAGTIEAGVSIISPEIIGGSYRTGTSGERFELKSSGNMTFYGPNYIHMGTGLSTAPDSAVLRPVQEAGLTGLSLSTYLNVVGGITAGSISTSSGMISYGPVIATSYEGTWNGNAIADSKISSASAWNAKATVSVASGTYGSTPGSCNVRPITINGTVYHVLTTD